MYADKAKQLEECVLALSCLRRQDAAGIAVYAPWHPVYPIRIDSVNLINRLIFPYLWLDANVTGWVSFRD